MESFEWHGGRRERLHLALVSIDGKCNQLFARFFSSAESGNQQAVCKLICRGEKTHDTRTSVITMIERWLLIG